MIFHLSFSYSVFYVRVFITGFKSVNYFRGKFSRFLDLFGDFLLTFLLVDVQSLLRFFLSIYLFRSIVGFILLFNVNLFVSHVNNDWKVVFVTSSIL